MAKVIISLPDEFLKQVDDYAEKFNYNRSELVRSALREKINGKGKIKNHETA